MSARLRLFGTAFSVCYMEYGKWEAVEVLLAMEIQSRVQIFVQFNSQQVFIKPCQKWRGEN